MPMTSRERMLAAINYESPDKLPVVYHPSPAGLYVHGEKLLKLFQDNPGDNAVEFKSISQPPPETIDENGAYHEIKTDGWGTEWEFLIFGIQGHPRAYPFESWKEAADYEFPDVWCSDAEEVKRYKQTYLFYEGGISIMEKLQALRPMDEVLMDIYTQDDYFMAFLDRLVDYMLEMVQAKLDAGVDMVFFGDDWGTQTAPIISPDMFREIFLPRYVKLMDPIHSAGRGVFFHTCGQLGPLFKDLVNLGIRVIWPQIIPFESDPANLQACVDNKVGVFIHPDRQNLIPLGTPREIEKTIKRYAETFHNLGGGGIFYVEIENDAPFENVKALIESVQAYR